MKASQLVFYALSDLCALYLPRWRKRDKFAFLVHPRDVSDITRKYPLLHVLSEKQAGFFLRHLWPITLSTVHGLKNVHTGEELVGYVIAAPLSAEQMKNDPKRARKRIIQAARLAERKGASVIGLGALTASFTRGGLDVTPNVKADITTGRMYTSKIIVDTIEKAITTLHLKKDDLTIAIVGAAGSIGTACAQILVRHTFRHITLLDLPRKRERLLGLDAIMKKLGNGTSVEVSHDMQDLKKADVIIAVTNTPEAVIRSSYIKPGAVIVDDAQPSDVDPEVITKRNDVLVLEGGVAHADHIDTHFNFGLRHKNDLYSCLAEAIILAGIGHRGHYGVGAVSLLDMSLYEQMEADAKKVGIHVGALQNVEKMYTEEDFEHIRSILMK